MEKKSAIITNTLVILGIFIAVYFLFIYGTLPDKSDFVVDFNQVRDQADSDTTELPIQINYFVVATGELPD